MKVNELELKVANAEEKVAKTEKTIERHEKALAKKIALLEKASGRTVDVTDINSYKWDASNEHKSYPYYWEACEVSTKLEDIKGANKKLAEAQQILRNWNVKLENEKNKDNFLEMNTPQVIIDFLEDWKVKVTAYYLEHFEDTKKAFASIDKKVTETEIAFIKANPVEYARMLTEDGEIHSYYFNNDGSLSNIRPASPIKSHLEELELDYKTVQKKKANFAGAVVLKMRTLGKVERVAWLEKTIEADMKAKMLDLISRINAVVGTITDAKGLYVTESGDINGFVIGTQGKATVETIGAGGYNIQRFHYRTLVKEIK